MNDLTYSATDGVWQGELLDRPLCHKCFETHDHACTPPSKPLSDDAISLPPRPITSGITGSLSLHEYRKFLSKSADCIDDLADHAGKKLKRKTAALHLNRPPALKISYPVSVSSAASPTPPLSPSYSHSIISQRSEEVEIEEAQTIRYQPHTPRGPQSPREPQSPRVTLVSENGTRARPNRKRLNTFREKLEQKAQAQAEARAKEASDSMLASTQAVATVSHGGACFEILNPRKSLDLARIVSYIEDVDSYSLDNRDSTFYDQGLDRVSLSQFTDASLPSFYSTNSIYTSLPADPSTPKATDNPSSSPGIRDRVRSLSDFSLSEQSFNYWSRPVQNDLTTDHEIPMTSIREESQSPALSHSHSNTVTHSRRPSTPSTQDFYSESEIGEPGSPVYANGEWAQVDERDRGIFFEMDDYQPSSQPSHSDPDTEPYQQPMTPHETSSPISPYGNDKLFDYDPMYFDPHVQSVLAAANAENMGLRGNPARALEELQRGRERDVRERKEKRGLKKFFSWRSGSN